MARRQRGKMDPPAVEKRVGSDDQRVHLVADQRRERHLDLAAVARLPQGCPWQRSRPLGGAAVHWPLNDADLDADLRCCRLQVSGDGLGILILGVDQSPKRLAAGSSSRSSPSCLGANSLNWKLTPVALPPGRAMLATRPRLTRSSVTLKMMGRLAVVAFAASAAGVPMATITATWRRSSSLAMVGSRSYWPSANRYSIPRLCPST